MEKTPCRLVIDPHKRNMVQQYTVIAIFESEDGKIKQGDHIGKFDNVAALARWLVEHEDSVAIFNQNVKWGG